MEIHCSYDEIIELKALKPHPKNPNKHSEEQILRLAKIISYQGIRRPIRVSNRSGFITAGHGLALALEHLGQKDAPINLQDYQDEEQEYADIIADNSIASWADLDFSAINLEIPNLGPDFDIDMLGVKNFFLDVSDRPINPSDEWNGMPEFTMEDKTAYRTIRIHFYNDEGINEFARTIEKIITSKTKFIWYPDIKIEKALDKRYGSES